jgi:signal transduction histidine kinase
MHEADIETEGAAPAPSGEERASYLAFVAHEMRNPLSTALWSAELLARLSPEERAGARGEKLAGMCLRTLARLRNLVEDHFLAERLGIGGIPVRPEPVSLAETLSAAIARAKVACDPSVGEGRVAAADRALLERALEALLAAAGKDDTPVRVSVAEREGWLEIGVHGAAPAAGAFDLPGRTSPSDQTGRALGLLMARAVASAHGGSLDPVRDGFLLRLHTQPAGGPQ